MSINPAQFIEVIRFKEATRAPEAFIVECAGIDNSDIDNIVAVECDGVKTEGHYKYVTFIVTTAQDVQGVIVAAMHDFDYQDLEYQLNK